MDEEGRLMKKGGGLKIQFEGGSFLPLRLAFFEFVLAFQNVLNTIKIV